MIIVIIVDNTLSTSNNHYQGFALNYSLLIAHITMFTLCHFSTYYYNKIKGTETLTFIKTILTSQAKSFKI